MTDFDRAFEIVLGVEGVFVDDPLDPGGMTKFGISERAYPAEDIRNLTLERAKKIYKQDYWETSGAYRLPWPWNLVLFDAAVNQGVSTATKLLQKSVGEVADGVIGPKTVATVCALGKEGLALFLADRALKYISTNGSSRYGRGWLKRLFILIMEESK